jgi:hypothetical protein
VISPRFVIVCSITRYVDEVLTRTNRLLSHLHPLSSFLSKTSLPAMHPFSI